ncbi:N-lysine methyltransferase SMYD2-A [Colletotrichum chlorophyti]|uniref:N-lysine methyltransferase SMYD2-A n=1 Tax=Colletotrichum chlorophyti TaxID=708187 RepID=A0A1Q8S808_9PEZI|nr:N-lysine methyltransferase SMYD2-A [Colletotrichum chlorophyti]
MRSSSVAAWLCLAAQHPIAVSACGDRPCASGPRRDDRSHFGVINTDELRLADELVLDGFRDPEEVRVRYGTDLKSENGLWEIRPSPGKGLGLFALRAIPKGTRIVDESPLFTIDPGELVKGQGFAFGAIATAVDAAFSGLNATARAAYLSCPEHRGADDAGWSREALIFRTNGYTMAGGGAIGIFPRIAKVNHSCRPNAGNVDVGGRRVIWAGREIAAGEEVTTTYAPLAQATEERRARLAQWGFRCDCRACAGREDDGKRVEIKRLMDVVERELGRDAFGGDVLLDAEKLVSLVEELGLADYLGKAYKYAAFAASRSGNVGSARLWAMKELSVHEFADTESGYARKARAFLNSLPPD